MGVVLLQKGHPLAYYSRVFCLLWELFCPRLQK